MSASATTQEPNEVPSSSRFQVCGLRIDATPLNCAVHELTAGTLRGAIHLCNAYTVSLASRDETYRTRLNAGARNLADGMPLVWLANRLGLADLGGRVYGPDLMAGCLDGGRSAGVRHYLYGTTPEVLHRLREVIAERWPGASVVGVEAPPFRPVTDGELAASMAVIQSSGAHIVWVGMGTPKQDEFVHRMAQQGDAAYVAIGAAFDFIAGNKRSAPPWMQRSGLEWLFRLVAEPRRLWRRYMVGNTVFVWNVLVRRRYGPVARA